MIIRSLLAAAACLVALPASAQTASKYYMRERIVGVPTTTATPPPAYSCAPFVQNSAPGNYTSRYDLGYTNSATTAMALCNAKTLELKTAGFCTWNNGTQTNAGWPSQNVNFVVGGYMANGLWSGPTATALNGTTCSKN